MAELSISLLSQADERFLAFPGFPLDAAAVTRQAPEAMFLSAEAGRPLARCSVWWSTPPPLEGRRVGYVGHLAATDARGLEGLLALACHTLAEKGCELAVGPIDGNTWQRYRLITERGEEPPFFLEPDNPDDWPGFFLAAGFTPLATYCSALNANLTALDPRLLLLAQRAHDAGYTIRQLDLERFEEELRRAHALSLLSFRDNFLYSPISEADFLAQYLGVRRFIRPDLVLLAERAGELVGFMFAIPDLLRPQRGEPMNTVILKTVAVHPAHAGQGLGSLLMARCQDAARQAGFTRAIHALFHESNFSGRISGHTARVFRRYTLYSRPLGARP
jgi:GNAT superfamily N-acetyltransferase